MKFHQKVVKEELQWAKLGQLQSALEAEARRADDAREEAARSHKLVESLRQAFEGGQKGMAIAANGSGDRFRLIQC
jgi:hypothetical protein